MTVVGKNNRQRYLWLWCVVSDHAKIQMFEESFLFFSVAVVRTQNSNLPPNLNFKSRMKESGIVKAGFCVWICYSGVGYVAACSSPLSEAQATCVGLRCVFIYVWGFRCVPFTFDSYNNWTHYVFCDSARSYIVINETSSLLLYQTSSRHATGKPGLKSVLMLQSLLHKKNTLLFAKLGWTNANLLKRLIEKAVLAVIQHDTSKLYMFKLKSMKSGHVSTGKSVYF